MVPNVTPADLVARLRARGLTLSCRGSPGGALPWRLVVTPGDAALTDADRAALKEHREAVLDLLYREEPDSGLSVGWPLSRIEDQPRADP